MMNSQNPARRGVLIPADPTAPCALVRLEEAGAPDPWTAGYGPLFAHLGEAVQSISWAGWSLWTGAGEHEQARRMNARAQKIARLAKAYSAVR